MLESAIVAAGDLPRPQSVQARAKTPASLRKRLEEIQEADNADLGSVRRDLAGVRLIFYTNNDVNRFINSSVVTDNFDVDHDGTKIHHPVEENGEVRYQAIHYTVSMNDARAQLPEYRDFVGLRCEIQIQTILIHAWAETSHDIIYKADAREGFGNQALNQIKKRFNRIMDKYLVPAGYEFQRVQQDYERLLAGKQLFDQDMLESLEVAKDNNLRYELIQSLLDDLLPLYDDIPSIFPEILDVTVRATEAARRTTTQPRKTPFTSVDGYTSEQMVGTVIDLIDRYKYAAIEESFVALKRLFAQEDDERLRKRIIEVVGKLARYNLAAWEHVGPEVQYRLAEVVNKLDGEDKSLRPLAIEVWKSLLSAEATSTTWSANSASMNSSEVPVDQVRNLRQQALSALFIMFDKAESDGERREIYYAIENATRGGRNSPSAQLVRECLSDGTSIAEFLTARATDLSYELRETIEHAALYEFYRVCELLSAEDDPLASKTQATALKKAILELSKRMNEDSTYGRYKILVGFDGVMPWQWEDRENDHERVETYRDEQLELMLLEVTVETRASWLGFLERCAATKSDDLATFPRFFKFLERLSETKPEIAAFVLDGASSDLLRFLSAFLDGFSKAEDKRFYKEVLERNLSGHGRLWSIAAHLRQYKSDDPSTLSRLLSRAIEDEETWTVAQCVVIAMQNFTERTPPHERFFRPAIRYLIARKAWQWVRIAQVPKKTAFFEGLESIDAKLILESLIEVPDVTYDVDRRHPTVTAGHGRWSRGQRSDHPKLGQTDRRRG